MAMAKSVNGLSGLGLASLADTDGDGYRAARKWALVGAVAFTLGVIAGMAISARLSATQVQT